MADVPEVQPHDEVTIDRQRAVVATVHGPGEIEVVWLDYRHRAINEDAVWREGHWQFKRTSPGGGHADHIDRLADVVRQLRSFRR